MFIDRIGLSINDLEHNLVVSTPTSATLTIGLCVSGITVVIQCRMLSMDFVVLSMGEVYAIFGMEWMTRHRALIDCLKKKVQLHLSSHEKATFEGRGSGSRGSFISFQRV